MIKVQMNKKTKKLYKRSNEQQDKGIIENNTTLFFSVKY